MKAKQILLISICIMLLICSSVFLFGCKKDENAEAQISTVTFYIDEEEYASCNLEEAELVMPENPKKEGFAFCGWYLDKESLRNPFAIEKIKNDGPAKVYSKWEACSVGLEFEKIDNHYVVTGYTGSEGVVNIPSKFDGVDVTKIGDYAFKENSVVNQINIPLSINQIGAEAFYKCPSLRMYEFQNGYYIGDSSNYYKVLLGVMDKDITEFKVHPDTKYIASYTFEGCNKLRKIDMSKNVVSIGKCAFAGCRKLKHIELTEDIKYIGDQAFAVCTALVDLKVSPNLEYLGEGAFYDCRALESITIPNLKEIKDNTYAGCNKIKEVKIPSTVTKIGYGAFANCLSLEKVELHENIIDIEDKAFYNCSSLKSANIEETKITCFKNFLGRTLVEIKSIPSTVTKIDEYAFSYTKATKIVVPESVTELGSWCFDDCIGLKSIDINTSNLEKYDYLGIDDEVKVNVSGPELKYESIDYSKLIETVKDNVIYKGDKTNPYKILYDVKDENIKEIVLEDTTEEIYYSAFYRIALDKITLNANLKVMNANLISKEVILKEGNKNFVLVDGDLYTKDLKRLIWVGQKEGKRYKVRDEVANIEMDAFYNIKDKEIEVNAQAARDLRAVNNIGTLIMSEGFLPTYVMDSEYDFNIHCHTLYSYYFPYETYEWLRVNCGDCRILRRTSTNKTFDEPTIEQK